MSVKSVILEHPKTSLKLSKAIRQTEKVSQVGAGKNSDSPLYSQTKKSENCFDETNVKIRKWSRAFKGLQGLRVSKFWILLILNYNLKTSNLQLEIN